MTRTEISLDVRIDLEFEDTNDIRLSVSILTRQTVEVK